MWRAFFALRRLLGREPDPRASWVYSTWADWMRQMPTLDVERIKVRLIDNWADRLDEDLWEVKMPFAGYANHAYCVAHNRDKADPDAYCAVIERKVKEGRKVLELRDWQPGSPITAHSAFNLWQGDLVTIVTSELLYDGFVEKLDKRGFTIETGMGQPYPPRLAD